MHATSLNLQDKDIAAICSGNGEIRWIKLSEYYQTGKLNFIEKPSSPEQDQTTTEKNNNCLICSFLSQLDNSKIALLPHSITIENKPVEAPFSLLQHFTKHSTLVSSSRDPPILIK